MKIIKKMFSIVLILTLVIKTMTPVYVYAQTNDIEYFEDGSFIITELIEPNSLARTAKSAKKSSTYYSASGVEQWKVTLTGTFTYDGKTSKATNASIDVSIYKSGWSTTSKSATYSGNKAIGSVKVSKNATNISKSLSISCSKSGIIS